MTQEHPITPPPELVQQWMEELYGGPVSVISPFDQRVLIAAAQWGADQELEACCEWLDRNNQWARCDIDELRDGRRPKPQTLNSIALQMLGTIEKMDVVIPEITDTIRRALEALTDD
jgi:hypothetical protein